MELSAFNWDVWSVPGILAVLGLVLFLIGFVRLIRLKVISGLSGAMFGALLMVIGVAGGLIGLNLHTYKRLSYEQPVAELSLTQRGPQSYIATLRTPDGEAADYELYGDQWRLEARVLKWKPWANVMGLDAQYRLDRISGRYATAEAENTQPRSNYDLADNPGIDLWDMLQKHKQLAPMADAIYGSGTYLPMADGAAYEVTLSQSGLVARPLNQAAMEATQTTW